MQVIDDNGTIHTLRGTLHQTADGYFVGSWWEGLWWKLPNWASGAGQIIEYNAREWMAIHEDTRPCIEEMYTTKEGAESHVYEG